jgi:hypothetical protein
MKIILTLTEKYAAIVMNPPYMACNRTDVLAKYAKDNYPDAKADLFAVFMDVASNRLVEKGKYGMINMQSWMFLGSFEQLRINVISNYQIDSMIHLGSRTFDELAGEVVQNTAFIISNILPKNKGIYYRLTDGKNCDEKRNTFIASNGCGYTKAQNQFNLIPGCPIAYWVSEHTTNLFSQDSFAQYFRAQHGLLTGCDKDMVRSWSEVSFRLISFSSTSSQDFHSKNKIYAPLLKGGSFRKWYGNFDSLVKYDEKTIDYMKRYDNFVLKSEEKYFLEGLTWTLELHNGNMSIRYMPKGCIFSNRGPAVFANDGLFNLALLGFLFSKVASYFFNILSPTLSISAGTFNKIPVANLNKWRGSNQSVQLNIKISKQDWDAHETSWDFANNELLAVDTDTYIDNIKCQTEKHFKETGEQICIDPAAPQLNSLVWRMEQYQLKWERLFMQLHANEEDLNRQFIDIYGLQDELTPDVPLADITILQQGEINVTGDGISFNEDVIVKQFISYAVGCMMGRYRLDRPGLAIAHPDAKAEEYAPYQYNGGTFEIDDDGIVPLMPASCAFTDNANLRFKHWLALALGQDSLVENLNFVEKCLGKPIDEYFVKDFWKDHKKMYQNRPIYWMFASKKGAFQCIAYMHRMNAYTAERIRSNYLLPHIEWLVQKQQELQNNAANLSTAERRSLDNITKQIAECREYHDRLHVIADKQIAFDLDDGVVVNYAKFGDVVSKLK